MTDEQAKQIEKEIAADIAGFLKGRSKPRQVWVSVLYEQCLARIDVDIDKIWGIFENEDN